MKMAAWAACLGLMVAMGAWGDGSPIDDLLPRPKCVEEREDTLPIEPAAWTFSLEAPDADALGRLNERLAESMERADITPKIRTVTKRGFSLVISEGRRHSGGSLKDLETFKKERRDQGYVLEITKRAITVKAQAEQGLFYGMMTLEQLLRSAQTREQQCLPCMRIVDAPALAMRGFSEDYGRDQLPTMEAHKAAIRALAQFKMNTYLWFIEPDHFVYTFDPDISTEYDRFKFDEISELVAYAKRYYIEVIPTVELLGHMEMTLRNPKYKGLAEMPEGGGDLCATSDASFDLVRKMVGEIAPAFGGRYFHCGLDESYAIGKGRSAQAVKEKGIERVFADYYTRMDELVKSNGRTMMMYADIVLNHANMIPMLPKDIVMMFWDYSPRDTYPGLDTLSKSGFPITALSGLWSWNNLYPLYVPAFKNIETLAAQAAKTGALGHFVSGWGDGYKGAAGFNLSELDFYGVAYTCAVSWKPEPIPMEAFSSAYAAQFFGTADPAISNALTRLARCQGPDLSMTCKARFMFHTDAEEAVWSMADASEDTLAFWKNLESDAKSVHEALATARAARNEDWLHIVDLAARMLECSARMAQTFHAIGAGLNEPGFDRNRWAGELDTLAASHAALWDDYKAVWLATNRPLNIEHIGKVWSATTEGMKKLAQDLRAGRFPAPVTQGLHAAFSFDGAGDTAWHADAGSDLKLSPAGDGPKPTIAVGGPSGHGGHLHLDHGARCEALDTKRTLDFRTNPFTVEAWVRHNGQQEQQYGATIVSFGDGGGWRLGINHKGETLFTLYGIGEQAGTKAIVPADGAWHHVAVAFHHCKNIDYYIDGRLADQRELKGSPRSPGKPLIRIGNEIGLVTAFAGDIDRIRISAGQLSLTALDAAP